MKTAFQLDAIGTVRQVMSTKSTLVKDKEIYGIRWELWSCDDGCGIVRLHDLGTGRAVFLCKYPTLDRARASFTNDGSSAPLVVNAK